MKKPLKNIIGRNSTIYIVIFIITIMTYGNTFFHEFAYDDFSVITGNTFTQKGFTGIIDHLRHDSFYGFTGKENLFEGGRYRPLSLITFSIEYGLWGENPYLNHIINILLFALSMMLLYKLLVMLFKLELSTNLKLNFYTIPFVVVVLFITHPIHTEVLANIKGRDEILVLLFSILSFIYALKYWNYKKLKDLAFSGLFLIFGLLSKENAVVFLFLIPIGIWMFHNKVSVIKLFPIILSLASSVIIFLILRQSVLGGVQVAASQADNIVNNSFMYANGWREIYGTIFYTWSKYLYLLFIPYPLTIDYYPFHIELVDVFSIKSILPLIAFLLLGVLGLYGMIRKEKWAYGIIFFLISFSLVSNFFFIIGPFMGERFMFLPSLGFIVLIVVIGIDFIPKWTKAKISKNTVILFFSIVSFALAIITIERNFDWKNNFTLYTTDVKTSKKSAIINQSAAQELLNKAIELKNRRSLRSERMLYLEDARKYLIYATDVNETNSGLLLLGNVYFEQEKFDFAVQTFDRLLGRKVDHEMAYKNMLASLNLSQNNKLKLSGYKKLLKIKPDYEAYSKLGQTWGKDYRQPDSAIFYLKKAVELDKTRSDAMGDLGLAYVIKGDLNEALKYLLLANEISPNDKQLLINIGITYQNLQNDEKAQLYFEKANQLED